MFVRPPTETNPLRRICVVLTVALGASVVSAAPAAAQRNVTIDGGGFGHGIGMSQYGAFGRAKRGDGYRKILGHYYKQTSVVSRKMPKRIRVGLAQGRNQLNVSTQPFGDGSGRGSWKVAGGSERLAAGGPGTPWRVEPSSTGALRLYKNDKRVRRDGKGTWGSPDRPLMFKFAPHGSLARVSEKNNNYAYGSMEFATYASDSCSSGYCLRLVLSLPMQRYLYGLGEVPSSWPRAALQTQAVAGRTYAYEKIQRSGQNRYPCGCAVYDSVLDQAYIGDAKRTGSGEWWDDWKGAVDSTKNEIVVHGGAPIQALYSSTSGGHTENNENVWGGSPLPYLRGVRDGPDKASPYHDWTVKLSFSEFERKLNAAYGIGSLKDFELLKPFGVSGRVTIEKAADKGGARIVGTQKVARASGWSLRSALSLRDTLFRVSIDQPVAKRFRARYRTLDGAPGEPRSGGYLVPRGADRTKGLAQDFARGRMTYTRKLDEVSWQWGKVLRAYDRAGRERSKIGMPTSDVWGPGRYRGGTYTNGVIVWRRDADRSYVVRGRFFDALRRAGGIGKLGVPAGKRRKAKGLPNGGREQRFARGTLYSVPSSKKVFALWGPIDERFRKLGKAASACGYPTGDVVMTDGRAVASFESGQISWTEKDGSRVDC